MTFYSGSGLEDIIPPSFEKRLSSLIKFPKLAYNVDIGEYYNFTKPTKTKALTPLSLLYCLYILIF